MIDSYESFYGVSVPQEIPYDACVKMIKARWGPGADDREATAIRNRWGTESGFLTAVEHIYEHNNIKFSAEEIRWWKFFLQGNNRPGDPSKLPKRTTKRNTKEK